VKTEQKLFIYGLKAVRGNRVFIKGCRWIDAGAVIEKAKQLGLEVEFDKAVGSGEDYANAIGLSYEFRKLILEDSRKDMAVSFLEFLVRGGTR